MDTEKVKYTVKWWLASYSGTTTVWADPNAEREEIIGLAKREIRRDMVSIPFGYERFHIERED